MVDVCRAARRHRRSRRAEVDLPGRRSRAHELISAARGRQDEHCEAHRSLGHGRNVDLRGFGGATFRQEAKQRGLEPDECYKLGALHEDDVPDIAIEVIVSSGLVDRMAVYAGLGVPEVWIWSPPAAALAMHRLVDGRYEVRERSEVLIDLDVADLSRFVRPGESQTQLARAYQATLRRQARAR